MRRLLLALSISGVVVLAFPLPGAFGQQTNDPPRSSTAEPSPALTQAVAEALQISAPGASSSGPQPEQGGFFKRLFRAYVDEFNEPQGTEAEPPRRSMPSPWNAPPFPGSEYQGYPLIGIPYGPSQYPLMKALSGTWLGNALNAARINVYGWINASANLSSSKDSNSPESYWLVPNDALLDQLLLRFERLPDTVQTDHLDWGFRSSFLYGVDYRYMTAGGWFSDQLLKYNQLYGFDPTEQYIDVYFPGVAQGTILRVGRWIACPDIETQFAPDNYLGSHSLLFTFDTYTQTGFMVTHQLSKQWMFQWGVHAGTDMAPWYKGATPTGFLGVRWVAADNNDSVYLVLNSINDAKFQRFKVAGQPAGHDNFNYLVGTWSHLFTSTGSIHTQTEGYFMWQRNAVLGGTPSLGPVKSFGGGGGIGADIPGLSKTYGILNYTMFALSKRDYFTVRNEWWRDEQGERTGFPSTYTSHTIGLSHQLSPSIMIRPEVGYFHSYDAKAFDNGKRNYLWQAGVDMTVRF